MNIYFCFVTINIGYPKMTIKNPKGLLIKFLMDTIREKVKKYLNQDFNKIYKISKIICY